MKIVVDPSGNVWDDNPHLLATKFFSDLKRDLGADLSDRLLRAIYYIYDVRSPLTESGKSFDEIVEDVNHTVLEDNSFDWNKYQYVVDEYTKVVPTKAQAELSRYQREITELNEFLNNWPWSEDNVKDKTKALIDAEKIWNIYLSLKDKVSSEEKSTGSYGGYTKSRLESY